MYHVTMGKKRLLLRVLLHRLFPCATNTPCGNFTLMKPFHGNVFQHLDGLSGTQPPLMFRMTGSEALLRPR